MLANALIIPFDSAKKYIKEGDILLFRGEGFVAWWLARAGDGEHSHVAVASWNGEIIECIEFREWKGGRTVNLKTQVENYPKRIDVYRPSSPMELVSARFGEGGFELIKTSKRYNGKLVTNAMRQLTGLPYGWQRIFWLARYHIPVIRWFSDPDVNDSESNLYPVCSTAIAATFREHYVDLVKFQSDQRTEPADIARSAILNYLFTLDK